MKVGSLVECVCFSEGCCKVSGVKVNLNPNIQVGTILTVKLIRPEWDGSVSLLFEEIKHAIHPNTKNEVGYVIQHFREIQPPMVVDIESLIEQPIEHDSH